jgi:hypothetical protein
LDPKFRALIEQAMKDEEEGARQERKIPSGSGEDGVQRKYKHE